MEKVSIVLPVYNGQKYLRESIESILKQTYEDYELIIVNDASTDHTLEIAAEYAAKDSRIRVFSNDHNSKLPQSLNNGFAQASGEFYTWTSDDNVMLPDCLERMVETFREHPEVDLIYGKQAFIDESGKITGHRKYPKDMDDIYIRDIVGACFMYRKKVQEKLGGYDISKFLVEDYDFWLRAYEQFRFYYLPEELYLYRNHPGSLTSRRTEDQKQAVIQLLQDALQRISDPKKRVKIEAGLSYQYFWLSDYYFKKIRHSSITKDWAALLPHRIKVMAKELFGRQ